MRDPREKWSKIIFWHAQFLRFHCSLPSPVLTHICPCSKLPVQNFDHGWRDIRTVRDPGGSVLHDELRVKCDRSHLVVKPYCVMTAKSKPLRIRRPKPLSVKLKINKGTYTYKSSQLACLLFNLSDTNYIYHHKLPLCRRERFSLYLDVRDILDCLEDFQTLYTQIPAW